MDSNESKKSGISLVDLLLVAFIVLKLCGVIDWSWWWVLSPAWICIAFFTIVYVLKSLANR